MTSIKSWGSLVKFSHTVFSLPFAFIGFGLGFLEFSNQFNWSSLIYMVLCVIFARNAAMAFNRFADFKIDAKNERTKNREIPANIISPNKAMAFVLINTLLFIITTYLINPLALYLSPIALFVIIIYSASKRFTWLCHFILGLGLSIAPIGAYIVLSGKFAIAPLLVSGAVLLWVGGFDILYALQDEEFDRAEKLHSIPQQFGRKKALIISAVSHFGSIIFLVFFGFNHESTWIYWTGLAVFTAILTWEHLIVKPSDISRVNIAFATLNASASVIFALFTLIDMFSFYLFG
jgi:4-hydroxybenzoate polyprenyltransferase